MSCSREIEIDLIKEIKVLENSLKKNQKLSVDAD